MTDGKLKVYWRVGSEKKITKRYRKGWRARHVQWDPTGERVLVLWEREQPPGEPQPLLPLAGPS